MPVLLYRDLCEKLLNPPIRVWFKKTFEAKPDSVAVVNCPYPVDGASQWVVQDKAIIPEVGKKLGTRSRVWSLEQFNEYLACFGDPPEPDCKSAATRIYREFYDSERFGGNSY